MTVRGSRPPGFTLIELLIVVVIIAIIAAVAIPNISSYMAKGKTRQAEQAEAAVTQMAETPIEDKGTPLPGQPPQVREIDLNIALTASHRVVGLGVHTWFDATLQGELTLSPRGGKNEPVLLAFPFPRGSDQASRVSLLLKQPDGSFAEPKGVNYTASGVFWSGPPPAEERFIIRISYALQGRDRFTYALPGQGRTDRVHVLMTMDQASEALIPTGALQPTGIEAGRMAWTFDQWVSDHRTIVVEMPTVDTPMGRVALLGKLAGVAVLLFGAGFWYLCESRKPGVLDTFRWGHFLLLALTYSLFFIIFEVLVFRYEMATDMAMAVAAGLSLPLLVIHVSINFLDPALNWLFALSRVLPLAVFSLSLVVVGVYGAHWRESVYVGAVVVVLGWITITYKSWSAGRRAHRQERQRQRLRRESEAPIRATLERLRALPRLHVATELLLREVREEMARLVRPAPALGRLHKEWHALSREIGELEQALIRTSEIPDEELHKESCRTLEEKARELEERMRETASRMQREVAQGRKHLEQTRQEQEAAQPVWEEGTARCMACGQAGPGESQYCYRCGERMPVRLACSECRALNHLPVHLLAVWPPPRPIHCLACGQLLENGGAPAVLGGRPEAGVPAWTTTAIDESALALSPGKG